jgi:hypothetical protein
VTAAVLVGAPAAQAAVPVLKVGASKPVVVKGRSFKPGEKVTLTIVGGKHWTTHATANANGAFTARVPGATLPACTAYSITAVGVGGKAKLAKKACPPTGKPAADVVFATSSVEVKGSGFRPSEHLTVTLAGEHTWSKPATASPTGTFLVDLGGLTLNACNQYTLTVKGSLGSTFSFDHPVAPC